MRYLLMTSLAACLPLVGAPVSFASDVTNIGDLRRGASVTVQGRVSRITDKDEFRLEDGTGSVLVYIGWKNRVMVNVNEEVTVKGVVDDDLRNFFRPEIMAQEIVRQDGSKVELR